MTRERKYILIAGALLLSLGLIYRFYPVVADFFSVSETVAVKKEQIHKYQKVIAGKKGLQKQKKMLEKRLKTLEKSLLTGTTASLAAVNVQDFIKKIADTEGIDIRSMRVLNPESEKEESKYMMIPVRFSITSGVRQFTNLLWQIESAPRLLIIQELSLDSLASQKPGKIRATVTVAGVMPRIRETG
ncbi:MAG: type II secretion system protein GspM [Desulfosalsimonadaceae bacterium]